MHITTGEVANVCSYIPEAWQQLFNQFRVTRIQNQGSRPICLGSSKVRKHNYKSIDPDDESLVISVRHLVP